MNWKSRKVVRLTFTPDIVGSGVELLIQLNTRGVDRDQRLLSFPVKCLHHCVIILWDSFAGT